MSNENVFISATFQGNDADNAELSSTDVVNAIQGFEESIKIISKTIYNRDCKVNCRLKPFKKGSFELGYIFAFLGIAPMLFNHTPIERLPDVLALLGELFKITKGKKVKKITQNNDKGLNIVVQEGGVVNFNAPISICNTIDVEVLKNIVNNDSLRENLTKSLTPVSDNSAQKVVYRNNQKRSILEIKKEDCSSFLPLNEKLTEDEKEMELLVKGLSFDGKKWDFKEKETGIFFSAAIKDDNFQKKVLEGKTFKNGDSIIANVFIKYSDKEGKKNQHTITKVTEHVVAPTQLTIK